MKGPKNGILKASIRETPLEYREFFYEASCMLLISVGQSYHEGEKLYATIELVNKKFKTCTIMLCDTLQKYNLMEYYDAQNAYQISLQNGNEWLERNEIFYSNLKIPCNIVRWDDILNEENYLSKLKLIQDIYNSNYNYKIAFTNTIENYLLRVKKRGEIINEDDKRKNSLNYLQEECAGMLIWADHGYAFEVYPNERAEVMAATYELIIKPLYPNVLVPVCLRFKRYFRKTQIYTNLELVV